MNFVKAFAIVFCCINTYNAAGAVLSDAGDMIQEEVQGASVSKLKRVKQVSLLYSISISYIWFISVRKEVSSIGMRRL